MNSQSAFTLIETLISFSILAILLAITLPLTQNFILHTQDEILQGQLIQAVKQAKSEAQARHALVGLCKSANQTSCSGEWNQGQLIFLDENADGDVHNSEQILAVLQTASQHGKIYWRSFPGYRDYLSFLPTGLMSSDNGTFWHCHETSPIWAIIINKAGRIRIAYPDENGEIRDGHAQPLSC
jgi:type IV fimbrial biogenesis protein FimT